MTTKVQIYKTMGQTPRPPAGAVSAQIGEAKRAEAAYKASPEGQARAMFPNAITDQHALYLKFLYDSPPNFYTSVASAYNQQPTQEAKDFYIVAINDLIQQVAPDQWQYLWQVLPLDLLKWVLTTVHPGNDAYLYTRWANEDIVGYLEEHLTLMKTYPEVIPGVVNHFSQKWVPANWAEVVPLDLVIRFSQWAFPTNELFWDIIYKRWIIENPEAFAQNWINGYRTFTDATEQLDYANKVRGILERNAPKNFMEVIDNQTANTLMKMFFPDKVKEIAAASVTEGGSDANAKQMGMVFYSHFRRGCGIGWNRRRIKTKEKGRLMGIKIDFGFGEFVPSADLMDNVTDWAIDMAEDMGIPVGEVLEKLNRNTGGAAGSGTPSGATAQVGQGDFAQWWSTLDKRWVWGGVAGAGVLATIGIVAAAMPKRQRTAYR